MAALATPPLVATQLTIPPLPRGLVERPRLRTALERGAEGPVTLVCGPAGSGKTILLSSTFGVHAGTVAWVSLEAGDDRPGRLAAAILAALGAPSPAAPSTLRRSLVEALTGPVVLVLDDVHVLRARGCLAQLAEVVAHPPHGLHLVLGSRSDPVLPLHLPRLHGSLTEIRADDLAFRAPEANALLLAHGLELSAELVDTLCRRTEGWAAGLRLAALGLQRHADPERFVAEFAGDDRVVADYLLAEVLHGEPPRRRRFLLQTSIADRLCGGLADAITGETDGAITLEALARDNGFVVALDSQRREYRMHRLFGELLRVHARRALGDGLLELHRRAALWYIDAGEPADAARHAAAGADWDLTTDLVATHWLELSAAAGANALRAILAQVPAERRDTDPRVAAVLACLELEAGQADEAEGHLTGATSEVDSPRHLDTLALAQLRAAHLHGRLDQAHEIARALLDDSDSGDRWPRPLRHAITHRELGAAGLWARSPKPAIDELSKAIALGRAHGFEDLALSALGHMALVQALRAGPEAARELVHDALGEAAARSRSTGVEAVPGHLAAGVVALLERRLADAETSLAAARDALSAGENAWLGATLQLVAAELDAAHGDADAALRRVDALELHAASGPVSALAAALRARVLVEQLGDCDGARATLARAAHDAGQAELDVAAARLHLVAGDGANALRVLECARTGKPLLGVTPVEAAMLEARAHEQLRDAPAADAAFEAALVLADTSGHRAVFLAAGRSVEPLLRRRIRHGTACPELVCELLQASQRRELPLRAAAPLLEPLSAREQMILRYLPTTLSNREMASELFVTTNTVKTHLRSIYRKLGVAGRREAVERARALRLVAPNR